MNRNFSQTITFRTQNPDEILRTLAAWDANQAACDIMGYMGTRMLVDREVKDQYVIVADFGVVDPDVSAAEEAERNNDRPETREWARRFLELIEGEPEYHHFDEIYRTDHMTDHL